MNKKIYLLVVLMLVTMSARAQQRYSDGLDDVMQYVPYASVFALKACGVESRDDWKKLAITTAASWVVTAGTGWVIKHTVKEWRPDESDQKSFPSGHTMIAFAGATALHKEFGKVSPWISVAGYGVATFVAVDRVARIVIIGMMSWQGQDLGSLSQKRHGGFLINSSPGRRATLPLASLVTRLTSLWLCNYTTGREIPLIFWYSSRA